jgi:hypothetical protein
MSDNQITGILQSNISCNLEMRFSTRKDEFLELKKKQISGIGKWAEISIQIKDAGLFVLLNPASV